MTSKLISLFTFGAALVVATPASAIPFQIQGSSLDATFDSGGALGSYSDNSMDSPIDLADGESFEFDFGTVLAPFALGSGSVDLSIDLQGPTADGPVVGSGDFSIASLILVLAADVDWGAPVLFDYSYNGQSGGLFELDLYDIDSLLVAGIHVRGTITNLESPVSVPEPGTLSLLGAGLLAIGFAGRRRRRRELII